jgi:hypothetical protein
MPGSSFSTLGERAGASDRNHGEHGHHQPLQGTRSGVGIDPEEHLDPIPRDQCEECKRGSYTPRRAFTKKRTRRRPDIVFSSIGRLERPKPETSRPPVA